ncbi:topoisomerase C-terminal repeat-containing protein (plasmid) [Macrococcoides bohemicum]|uniref:type IA DNA topoisomerase n=1 Tax=Macrococcoides bohemicum TaxID=1903056 RepID=UPI001C602CA1|nr:type IA DNA topoisomerase [Macrococcus bohemicus]QYA46027.1 topoisomerase C-terminal repeat-containing protein [Macrococcus bohemicus]
MKTVIIAEKPDQAKKYGVALGNFNRKSGYLEGKSDIFPGEVFITWCVGHLVELAPMNKYDEKYSKWKLEDLPFLPKQFKYQSKYSVKDQFNAMKNLLKSLSVNDQIIIATDPDREGEAIAYYVLNLLGIKNVAIKRLWANTQEPNELKNFFRKLKDGKETYKYYVETETRGKSDYLVGMNFTRMATILLQNKGIRTDGAFSVGRVQTPTLFMVYNREKEIENFKEKIYFDLIAEGEKDRIKYTLKSDIRLDTNTELQQYINDNGLNSANGTVENVTVTAKSTKAPKLFKLGGIQKVGNNKWGYSLDQTLSYVQSLYDKGYLSYPRTDSNLITTAEFDYLKNNIDNYKSLLNMDFEVKYTEPRKTYVDNDKVLEHYAIIPTKTIPTADQYNSFTKDEKNIYDAVVKQTMAIFADDYHYEQTKVDVLVSNTKFKVSGNTPKVLGWKNLSNEEEKEVQQTLPIFTKGEYLELNITGKEGKTKPPSYLTEASLGGEGGLMETCGKTLENDEMKEYLSSGIGTPATRGAIVKNIIDKGYIKVENKKLKVTDKGKILCETLGGSLISRAEMTGEWEERLSMISKGQETQNNFISGIEEFITLFYKELPVLISNNVKGESITNMNKTEYIGKCPKCKSNHVKHIKTPKYDFYACEDRSCGFTLNSVVFGKKLTEKQVEKLLINGTTGILKGLKGSKKSFDAEIIINDEYKLVPKFKK